MMALKMRVFLTDALAMTLQIALASGSIQAAQAAESFPRKFEGVWMRVNGVANACKASDWKGIGRTDDDRLISVSGRSVLFFESGCDLVAAKVHRVPAGYQKFVDGSAALTLSCSGEGDRAKQQEIWDVQMVNGQDLLVTANPETAAISVYARCR